MQKQIVEIQALRAFAAALVAFAHFHNEFLEKRYGWPLSFGAFGVDLFFVISGFIMLYVATPLFQERGAPINFFLRRLARIGPIYWLATFIFVVYVLESQTFSQANISWANVVGSILFIPTSRPSGHVLPTYSIGWTLNFEMFFYLLVAISLRMRRDVAIAFVSVVIFALFGLPKIFGRGIGSTLVFVSQPIVVEFVWGMWICWAYMNGWRVSRVLALALIVAGIAVVWYFTVNSGWLGGYRGLTWGVGAALIVVGFVLHEWRMQGWWRRVMSNLGDSSYALYVVHPLTMLFVKETAGRIWAYHHIVVPTTNWPTVIVLMIVSIILALIIHRRIELPITMWLYARINRMVPVGGRPEGSIGKGAPSQDDEARKLHEALVRLGWTPPRS